VKENVVMAQSDSMPLAAPDAVSVALRPYDESGREAFAAIYEESFPPTEREDTGELLASVDGARRRCWLGWVDGVAVGLAVVFRLEGTPVEFLEYFAVERDRRSRGLGASMLARLRPELDGAEGVLFEVERPHDATGAERELRERRISFYLRNGATIVECAPNYRAPDLADGAKTVPFTLMWLPLAAGAPVPTGSLLRRCVVAVLTQAYGLDPADPLVGAVATDLAC
jgi:GNAT superfamily N-acetyltransferase